MIRPHRKNRASPAPQRTGPPFPVAPHSRKGGLLKPEKTRRNPFHNRDSCRKRKDYLEKERLNSSKEDPVDNLHVNDDHIPELNLAHIPGTRFLEETARKAKQWCTRKHNMSASPPAGTAHLGSTTANLAFYT